MQVYKLCRDCGYKNRENVERCGVCGGKNLEIIEYKPLNYRYLYSILFFLFIIIIFYYFTFTGTIKREDIKGEIPVFLSEKKPINYYTYLKSIKNLSRLKKLDENDKKVIERSILSDDPQIREAALYVMDIWVKRSLLKEDEKERYIKILKMNKFKTN